MLRIIFGIFIIAHGLVHSGLAAAPVPNDPASKPGTFFAAPTRSRLLSRMGMGDVSIRMVGLTLVGLATLIFLLAGMGILGVSGLQVIWQTLAIVAAALSLLLLGLFWHSWLVVGVVIDLGILVSSLWGLWPEPGMA
jgi:hypothetical protein